MSNCSNCIYFRKKIDDLKNMNFEGTETGICLKHVRQVKESFKCFAWVDQSKELKCSRCGEKIKFLIYKPKKTSAAFPVFASDEIKFYADDKLCFECNQWAEEQTNKIFGFGAF